MHFSEPQIAQWLVHFRYYILFPLMVVAGPIVTVVAGSLASVGVFNFFIALPIIIFADLVGDIIYYAFGRYGGRVFVKKWGRWIGLTESRIDRLESHFGNQGARTLIIGKLTQAVGGPILVAAGMAAMPLGDFIWYNFLATVPKTLFFLLIGFYFAQLYLRLSRYSHDLSGAVVGMVILGILVYIWITRRVKSQNSQ